MADNEDLTEGARFASSVPARHEPFPLKGSCLAGTEEANRAPSVRSSLSAMAAFLPGVWTV